MSLARRNRAVLTLLAHVGLFACSWLLAFGLAYNFQRAELWFTTFFLPLLPFVLLVKLIVFVALGLPQGSWRYVSLRDVLQVTKAAWISFVWIFAVYYTLINIDQISAFFAARLGWHFIPAGLDVFQGAKFPDSVLLLDFAGTIALISGSRIAVRLYHEEIQPVMEGSAPKLLILGAGNAGETVVREILRQPVLQYRIEGFLDDDLSKHGSQIHGVPVLGSIDGVKQFCSEYAIDELLIAMPSATRKEIRRVVELCQGTNLRFKTLPAISDLIAGRAQVQQIRDVDINDLLGRAPIKLDDAGIERYIRGRITAVTGAGGSIGAEMCRQMGRFGPRRLLLIEQAEQNLFQIDRELRAAYPQIEIIPLIADICDGPRLREIFHRHRPSAVIHAAAHKHVPMMEENPGEAIKNNVGGTRTIADIASEAGCEKFVMISTDKAVNPTSIMGCSKRVAELYIQALNERSRTEFITVRFGNVLGSSGSVVPIFKEQIRAGGPVTITHPDMVRYFMTIPEAAQLVLQAAALGQGGEIFVLDMGEPVKIIDLARDLITLSGFRPGEDIEIRVSGLRPGEKLYEELSLDGEDVSRTAHPKIGIWKTRREPWETLVPAIDTLLHDANAFDRPTARHRLKGIVSEFCETLDENPAPVQSYVTESRMPLTSAASAPRE